MHDTIQSPSTALADAFLSNQMRCAQGLVIALQKRAAACVTSAANQHQRNHLQLQAWQQPP